MVVWVFSGGGEAELAGLQVFLTRNFVTHKFELKTPRRKKPGPRPGIITQAAIEAMGKTADSLVAQIKYFLPISLRDGICDTLLVVDDLDCHLLSEYQKKFSTAIDGILPNDRLKISTIMTFPSPELEAWLIADWENSFQKEFPVHHVQLRRNLREKYKQSRPDGLGDIDAPESFSYFAKDRNTCEQKLSEVIVNLAYDIVGDYSKDEHSGRMLQNINAITVCQKCPSARKLLQLLPESAS